MKKTVGDPNLYTQGQDLEGLELHDIGEKPIVFGGYPWHTPGDEYFRLPLRLKGKLRPELAWVAAQPSGGTIRFRTGSRRVALRARLDRNENFRSQPRNAESGFDVYTGAGAAMQFRHCICPDERSVDFLAVMPGQLPEDENDITIYTPLLNPLLEVAVGLDAGASLTEPARHAGDKPILFYGSSITQGFCASRPGLTYPAIICRELNASLINLGFGGNAKGDLEVAEAIAELDLACFVMDYDHNSPNAEYLRETHEPFFRAIRDAQPDLPVVFVSSPWLRADAEYFGKRAQVIIDTYQHARAGGDEKVFFVHGVSIMPENWTDCSIDRIHPNDHGFRHMANAIGATVRQALGWKDE